MKIADRIGNLLIFALVGFIAWKIATAREKDPAKEVIEYWESRDFKTDTIHVEVDYNKLPKPLFKYMVPPAVIKSYPIPKDSGVTIVMDEYLIKVIDSLQNRITEIQASFLTFEPEAPKILHGYFGRDSIALDLFTTDGYIVGYQWGTNYTKFEYQWNNGELRATPLPEIKHGEPSKLKFSMYGYIGYDIFLQSPLLKADYNVDLGKLRLQGSGYLPVRDAAGTGISLNLGYRIK